MAASASSTEEGRLASPRAVSLFLFCSSICLVLTVCLVCIRHNYGVFILQGFNQDIPEKLLLADPDFAGFERRNGFFPLYFVCMTQYDAAMPNVHVAFKPQSLANTFGQYISDHGLTQLRIAETEKYAHVTFFFNGGVEAPCKNEDRALIASPKVATYDLKPEMSAYEVTDELLARVRTAIRHTRTATGNSEIAQQGTYTVGDLTIDYNKHQVLVRGENAKLTLSEFRIVALLGKHAGRVMTYDSIIKELWGPRASGDNQILRVNMANIRRKIEKNPAEPEYLFTEVGVGYRMAESEN